MTTAYIVEDNTMTRLALQEALTDDGYKVLGSSASGEKAYNEIIKNQPEVILLDINLSGQMTGTTLGRKIREKIDCTIIYITAYGDSRTQEKILSTEPDGYIMKPYRMENVTAALRIALSRKRKKNTSPQHDDGSKPVVEIATTSGVKQIDLKSLKYIKSDGNYIDLHVEDAIFTLRLSLKKFMENYPEAEVKQIHQRYLINPAKISKRRTWELQIGNEWLPMGRKYRKIWEEEPTTSSLA